MTPPRPSASRRRLRIGVWAQWPRGSNWSNEGMVRLLGFLIEGAAASRQLSFEIVAPAFIAAEARADLRALAAHEGNDWRVHAPAEDTEGSPDETARALARFANQRVQVDGWLLLYPYFDHGLRLRGRKATIFPDSIVRVFPDYDSRWWGESGLHADWMERVSRALGGSDRVITFSQHVAQAQAGGLFGVPPDRISVIPHALPDLAHALPFKNVRGEASRAQAAALLRAHAAARGWRYLAEFPFEQAPFVAVSTQDRVSKNIALAADAIRRVLRNGHRDIKLITTAPLHMGARWTALPGLIQSEQLHRDIVSMPALPRDAHAALLHCASLTVHPAFFEGGHAPFPFSESVSVGTPCIFADGPHTAELLEGWPQLRRYVFDPYDAEALARLIERCVAEPDETIAAQTQVVRLMRQARDWSQVAQEYAFAAAGAARAKKPEGASANA